MKAVAGHARTKEQAGKIVLSLIKNLIGCLMISGTIDCRSHCLKTQPQFCLVSTHRQVMWLQMDQHPAWFRMLVHGPCHHLGINTSNTSQPIQDFAIHLPDKEELFSLLPRLNKTKLF